MQSTISRHCPGCGRENRGLRDCCLYCGAMLPTVDVAESDADLGELPPPPVSDHRGLDLLSPRRPGVPMEEMTLLGVTVHRCPATRGIFFDTATFHHLVHRQAALVEMKRRREGTKHAPNGVQRGEAEHRADYVNCPICEAQMSRRNYANCSGVIIDLCARHGVWLDDGELQALLTFIQTGGHDLAAFLREEDERHAKLREFRKKLDYLGPDSRRDYPGTPMT
jgi:Zn-finger nucleic acid-binding protein